MKYDGLYQLLKQKGPMHYNSNESTYSIDSIKNKYNVNGWKQEYMNLVKKKNVNTLGQFNKDRGKSQKKLDLYTWSQSFQYYVLINTISNRKIIQFLYVFKKYFSIKLSLNFGQNCFCKSNDFLIILHLKQQYNIPFTPKLAYRPRIFFNDCF